MKTKIIIATGNAGKVKEFANHLSDWDFEFITMTEAGFHQEIIEDADSFRGNAALKALTVAKALNLPTLADDSGLEVKALNGAPGIYSARYSGDGATDQSNNEKLLAELAVHQDRSARFACALCLAFPDGRNYFFDGFCPGSILTEPAGDQGFGYDPLFVPTGESRSFAQMSMSEKKAISHRGAAIREMNQWLSQSETAIF